MRNIACNELGVAEIEGLNCMIMSRARDYRYSFRGNVVTSHAAGPGSIPGWINLLVEVLPRISLSHMINVR